MKKYLFTTEDGVDIYDGDKYYTVNAKTHSTHIGLISFFKEKFNIDLPPIQHAGSIAGPYINRKWYEQDESLKYFFHRENAENFSKSLVV